MWFAFQSAFSHCVQPSLNHCFQCFMYQGQSLFYVKRLMTDFNEWKLQTFKPLTIQQYSTVQYSYMIQLQIKGRKKGKIVSLHASMEGLHL
jgi:hypothetical protein